MIYGPQRLYFGGLFLFLLAGRASTSAISPIQHRQAGEDDSPTPTPTWTPLSMALPWPYESPSLSIPPETPQTAVLGLLYSNPCGGATEFASTKTVNLPVDCQGATSLSVSLRVGRCPLGRTNGPPATVDTVGVDLPRTSFGYTCLPTPLPTTGSKVVTVNVADVTRTMELPSLARGQTPGLVPKGLEVVHHPGGECFVDLRLAPATTAFTYPPYESGVSTREGDERQRWTVDECNKSLRDPVSYASTVSKTIEVGCDGCAYIRGGVVTASCPRETFSSTKTARREERTTVWVYDCEKRA